MNEKKVIAVILEGPSDEAALGSILKEYFSSEEIQFVVVHGDITTKDYTSADNILSKINNLIESVKQKYGYRMEDFLKIIHIVDMDGAFCNDVIVKKDFVEFISQEDLIAPGTFKQTWRFIEKEKHSLERFTNMHLIFE